MTEFELIRHYFAGSGASRRDVALGVGDDCALLVPPAGELLAVTTDTLVAGRHYPLTTAPFDIGWKSLAVNLSDLAAMGAQPRWFLLALTLESVDQAWLAEFAAGLRALADEHGIALVGGDTTRGPQAIGITAIGSVPPGAALRRDGARPGDVVCVTGTLGDAALALSLLLADRHALPAGALRTRLDRPQPRVAAGLALRGLAHAALDLSDGLAGDLVHILNASGVGAEIDLGCLPMSPEFAARHVPEQRWALQLAGGDDYELCVCIPPDRLDEARAALRALDLPLTPIGHISANPGLRCYDHGRPVALDLDGYRHF
jgi:thiamine-monophosphate kinase